MFASWRRWLGQRLPDLPDLPPSAAGASTEVWGELAFLSLPTQVPHPPFQVSTVHSP